MTVTRALSQAIDLLEAELMFDYDSRHLPEESEANEQALATLLNLLNSLNAADEGK